MVARIGMYTQHMQITLIASCYNNLISIVWCIAVYIFFYISMLPIISYSYTLNLNTFYYSSITFSTIVFLSLLSFYIAIYYYTSITVYHNYKSVDLLLVILSSILFIYLLLYRITSTVEFYFYLECLTVVTTLLIILLNKNQYLNSYKGAIEAATLYFSMSVIGGASLLIGFLSFFYILGTSNLIYFSEVLNTSFIVVKGGFGAYFLIFSITLLIFGFLIKLGLYPMYY